MTAIPFIRPAISTDENSILALLEELENRVFDSGIFTTIFKSYLEDPLTCMFVAVGEENRICGFISCKGQPLLHHEGLVFEIQELIVTSTHQGRGIGKKLIESLKPELARLGAISLEVTSNKRRKEAHAFYQSVGFLNSHEKFTIYL
jgi:PhnO protein